MERSGQEVFWLRPEAAHIQQGLSEAEAMQLTYDYMTDPDAFNLIRIFSNKYIDERGELVESLSAHDKLKHFCL